MTQETHLVEQPSTAVGEVLSPSQLATWMGCQAKWMFRYLHGLREPQNGKRAQGSAIHEAIGLNFQQKIDSGKDAPVEAILDAYNGAWSAFACETEFSRDEDRETLRYQGEILVRKYMAEAAPGIRPAAVETAIDGEIGGVRVQGRLDLLTDDGAVIDLKNAGRKPSCIDAMQALQLTTYVLTTPGASGYARIDTLVRTKEPQLVQIGRHIDQQDIDGAERMYPLAQAGMRAGLYMPNRGSMMCSRRNCAYWAHCEAEFGGKVAAL